MPSTPYTVGDRVTLAGVTGFGVIHAIDTTRPFGLHYLVDYAPPRAPIHGGTVRNGRVREWFSADEMDAA